VETEDCATNPQKNNAVEDKEAEETEREKKHKIR
jgi:hypothetical protein